jgi:hypothetical protein
MSAVAEISKLYISDKIWRVEVFCPYCKKTHRHGGGDIMAPPNLGHRSSHCRKGSKEYVIKPRGTTFLTPGLGYGD